MPRRFYKVILDVEFPAGMVDDEAPTNPGSPPQSTTAVIEAAKILRDGCGATFVYCHIGRQGPIRSKADAVACIEEV